MKRLTSLLLCLLLLASLAVPAWATEGTSDPVQTVPCDHVWGEPEIFKPATCTTQGEQRYTCSQCSETKTEPTEKISHNFDSLVKVDESKHMLVCSMCRAAGQESSHVWSDGDVLTPSTCLKQGTRQLKCECGATATRVESLGPHTYDHDCDTTCNVCNAVRTTTHSYDNACDPDCNACGEKRTTSHS